MRFRIGTAAWLVVGAMLLGACSSGGASVASGPIAHSPMVVRTISAGPLRTAPVLLGPTDGALIPIARIPVDGSKVGPIFTLDPISGRITDLGRLPTSRFVTNVHLAMTDRRVIVSTGLCDTKPTSDDTGYDCATGATWGVFVHDDSGWARVVSVAPPTGPDPPTIDFVGDRMTLQPADPAATPLQLDGTQPAMYSALTQPFVDGHCANSTIDGATIGGSDLTPTSSVGFMTAPNESASINLSRLPVQPAQLTAGPRLYDCSSSGPYLAVHPTKATTEVVDLRHPSAPPTVIPRPAYFDDLISGRDYWGWRDDRGLHLRSSTGGALPDPKLKDGDWMVGPATAIAVFEHNGDTNTLQVIVPTPNGSTPPGTLSGRLVLPRHTMTAGSTMKATMVVNNQTGRPIRTTGCQGPALVFAASLESRSVHSPVAFAGVGCSQHRMVPKGKSTYRVTIGASYNGCGGTALPPLTTVACDPAHTAPPLPPGRYVAVATQDVDSGYPMVTISPGPPITVTP